MKMKAPHHYARLLAAQKLLKTCDEAKLAASKCQLTSLQQENDLLAAMMARGAQVDFIDPLLISQRMERNRRAQACLEASIEAQIEAWVKSSRRARRLAEKRKQAQAAQTRVELAAFLAEVTIQSLPSPSNR